MEEIVLGQVTGKPGVSPIATVTKAEGQVTIRITDVNGTSSASIPDPSTLTAEDIGAATAAQGARADSALQASDIVNNLTTTDAGKVLDARQGNVLGQKIDDLETTFAQVFDRVYPVGSIYMTMIDMDPSTLFGGEWTRVAQGRTLVGVDEEDADFAHAEMEGGEKKVALTEAQNGPHTHMQKYGTSAVTGGTDITGNMTTSSVGWRAGQIVNTGYYTNASGDGAPHENMPPYITCYIWQRIA